MQKILIITHSKDNASIDTVSGFLRESGAQVIRFNVDEYPLQCSLSSRFENGTWQIFLDRDGQRHSLHDITAVWYRRSHNLAYGLNQILEGTYLSSAQKEIRRTLFGMLESMPCFQIDTFSKYRRLDSKEEQMKIASALGLNIPDTCITNNPDEARDFVLSHPGGAIVKMQSSFAIYRDGKEHVVFTNIVSEKDLEAVDALQYCPMQFQEKLEKSKELRVTIVGDAVFTYAIDSQKMENAKIDWRREGNTLLDQWEPYQLPHEIEEKLLQIMDIYQINYGAIDIIVTPEEGYYFLEINAAGEYLWLDHLADGAISKQIARVLTGEAYRRYTPVLQKDRQPG
ncbi:MvdC/MvdD family ATP grasp protein [Sinomicrobium weinanense]|uniref:MvdD family ATP-grasp ribosomal peptide maturase n=1 Tax=Sinomicrobium weinanense TaxID=2842200 RepID=A0A926Q5B5_9FLAO|nr:MvdD family ATP-grasp ribosomal peptide maturase [Sinomicrobium weinanense]MBC9797785.1 MvdD family ATP-grasp ribosomal peptide maturase [Sinomicrobium weinanense]MBU3124869.1 MvdD family ATP-grasp ribosomal peptide maturase [Sinomicrobium weinanense]